QSPSAVLKDSHRSAHDSPRSRIQTLHPNSDPRAVLSELGLSDPRCIPFPPRITTYTCLAARADGSNHGSTMLQRDVAFPTGIIESSFSTSHCLITSRDERLHQTKSSSSWLKG